MAVHSPDSTASQADAAALNSIMRRIAMGTSPMMAVMNAVALLVCFGVLRGFAHGPLLYLWVVVGLLICAFRVLMHRRVKSAVDRPFPVRWYAVLAFMHGCSWGSVMLFFGQAQTMGDQFAITMFPLAITAASVGSYGTWMPAFMGFVMPILLPLVYTYATSDEPTLQGLAAPWFIYLGSLSVLAGIQGGRLREALELRYENAGLLSDMARQNEELAQARDAAEQGNRAKSEFLSRMSHEMRTPMNGVMGMAEVLVKTNLDTIQRNALGTLRDSSAQMVALINDLLDVSRLEVGEIEFDDRPFEPAALVQALANDQRVVAQGKALTLRVVIDPALPARLRGDPNRVRQALSNLVTNAIKFTRRGGVTIGVSLGQDIEQGQWIIDVQDTGIGMDDARVTNLFAVSDQPAGDTSKPAGGAGLGLSITASLIEQMGGSLSVESVASQGSLFRIGLPLQEVAEQKPCQFSDQTSGLISSQSPGKSAQSEFTQPGCLDPGDWAVPPRVLVVDDNPINQAVLLAMLEALDCEAETADDGLQAVEQLMEDKGFDLVFMDVQMPELDGLSATERLRRQGCQLPIVAATANAMEGDRELCLASGMNDYITKPFVQDTIAHVLNQQLGYRVRNGFSRDSRLTDVIERPSNAA